MSAAVSASTTSDSKTSAVAIEDVLLKEAFIRASFFQAIDEGNEKTVSALAQDPQLLEIRDALGCTPLIRAASKANKQICSILLDAGANPLAMSRHETQRAPGNYGTTVTHVINIGRNALHWAIEVDSSEIVQLLVKNVKLLDIPDGNNLSPIGLAGSKSFSIFKIIVKAKCDVDKTKVDDSLKDVFLKALRHGNTQTVDAMIEIQPLFVKITQYGMTTLMVAADSGQVKMCQSMIKANVDANATNGTDTALAYAVRMQNSGVVSYLTPLTNNAASIKASNNCFICWRVFCCVTKCLVSCGCAFGIPPKCPSFRQIIDNSYRGCC